MVIAICCKQRNLLLLFVFRLAVDLFFFFIVIYDHKSVEKISFKKHHYFCTLLAHCRRVALDDRERFHSRQSNRSYSYIRGSNVGCCVRVSRRSTFSVHLDHNYRYRIRPEIEIVMNSSIVRSHFRDEYSIRILLRQSFGYVVSLEWFRQNRLVSIYLIYT
jgi:hypothetical protein